MLRTRIRARLHASGTVTVHHEPSLLARLLGSRPRDLEVEYAGGVWVDQHGRYVGTGATAAIERALKLRAVGQRFEDSAKAMLGWRQ